MKFDIWDEEDIEQEIYFLLLQANEVYDPAKFDNDYVFCYNFVKNRLHNFRRDNGRAVQGASIEYDIAEEMGAYLDLYKEEIDKMIHATIRADYLKFREKVPIPYRNKCAVLDSIKKIVKNIQDV